MTKEAPPHREGLGVGLLSLSHFTPLSIRRGAGGEALEGEASQLLIHQQAFGSCALNGEWFERLHADDEHFYVAIERMVVAHIHEGWVEHLRTITMTAVVGEVAHNH